ncbi:F-box/kelch-repeat protein [Senna tora]|uniref:F-box/kelch-repeat protein n=1 Tax=Senna tora TaxID=362788 RepID=A0A834TYK2_9FABA|nr:F-box/kelch-repeat protein [Senna tora]
MPAYCERNLLPLEPSLLYCDGEEQTFCPLSQPHKIYRKTISALSADSTIVAHSSGWFLLAYQEHTHFSLWNPTIPHSFIHLPPLSLNPTPKIKHYFLSSPPGDPDCKVLLFDDVLGSVIFIRLEDPHKEWTRIQYARSFICPEGKETNKDCLGGCVSCNGKSYGFTIHGRELVILDVDKGNNLVMEPLCCKMPDVVPSTAGAIVSVFLRRLVECCGELLYVEIPFGASKMDRLNEVHVFRLDFVGMNWERAGSLMGQAVFLDAVGASSFNPAFGEGIEADSIYFTHFEDQGLMLYTFNVRDGCVSTTLPCPSVPSSSFSSPMIFVPPYVCMGVPNKWIENYTEHDAMFWLNNSSRVFYKGSFYLLDLEGKLSVLKYEEEEIDLEFHQTVS